MRKFSALIVIVVVFMNLESLCYAATKFSDNFSPGWCRLMRWTEEDLMHPGDCLNPQPNRGRHYYCTLSEIEQEDFQKVCFKCCLYFKGKISCQKLSLQPKKVIQLRNISQRIIAKLVILLDFRFRSYSP